MVHVVKNPFMEMLTFSLDKHCLGLDTIAVSPEPMNAM